MRTARRRTRAAIALVLLAWVAQAAAEPRAVEVYRPAHRLAEELLPLAEAALGDEGEAALDPGTNAVVLIGAPRAVASALALLRQQDRARPTVILRYESRRALDLEAAGLRVAWRVAAGDVRVGSVLGPPGATGLDVAVEGLRAEDSGAWRGTLRLLDGESGRIGAGRTVPVPLRGRYGPSTTFVTAERGFVATPRVLGDGSVRVAIAPTDATVDGEGRVTFGAAATEVILRPGEIVAIGSMGRTGASRTLGPAVRRDEAHEEELLLLSVEVEGSSPPPNPVTPRGGCP